MSLTGTQLQELGWSGTAIGELLKMQLAEPDAPWLSPELLREVAARPHDHLDHPDLDQAIYLLLISRRRRSRRRRPPPRKTVRRTLTLSGPQQLAAEVMLERWHAPVRDRLWQELITPPPRDWRADWQPARAGQPWSRAAARRLQLRLNGDQLTLSSDWPETDLEREAQIIQRHLETLLSS